MHLADITMFYAPAGGGVSTYLNAKSRWMKRRARVRHTIFTTNMPSHDNVRELPYLPVPGLHGYRWPWTVGRVARAVCELQPDLIETGDASSGAWATLRARDRLGIPAVAFYHSDTPRLLRRRCGPLIETGCERYMQALYRHFDLVLAPSRLMVQRLSAMGIPRAVHQPLGIDSATFCPERRDPAFRAQLGVAPDTRLLVYGGRFTPEKKLDILIDAVAQLGSPYHLVLVGSGVSRPRPCERLTVLPFVHDQDELARVLASCDALVHAGDGETYGLIALEAMACGLPVVYTGGGIAELVDATCGMRAQPDSASSMAGAIEALFATDIAALARNARLRAADHYDWNTIMPQLMARYEGALATFPHLEPAGSRGYVAD
jgi:alpha-1,6-mannosyltransferase